MRSKTDSEDVFVAYLVEFFSFAYLDYITIK